MWLEIVARARVIFCSRDEIRQPCGSEGLTDARPGRRMICSRRMLGEGPELAGDGDGDGKRRATMADGKMEMKTWIWGWMTGWGWEEGG